MRELTPDTIDMTTTELAMAIGVDRKTARKMCERGDVPARRIGTRWRVKVQSLRDLYPELWAEYLERYHRRIGMSTHFGESGDAGDVKRLFL